MTIDEKKTRVSLRTSELEVFD